MLNENGTHKIFGAGIISSIGKTAHVYSKASEKMPFDVYQMLATPYRTDMLQPLFFCNGAVPTIVICRASN